MFKAILPMESRGCVAEAEDLKVMQSKVVDSGIEENIISIIDSRHEDEDIHGG